MGTHVPEVKAPIEQNERQLNYAGIIEFLNIRMNL